MSEIIPDVGTAAHQTVISNRNCYTGSAAYRRLVDWYVSRAFGLTEPDAHLVKRDALLSEYTVNQLKVLIL